MSRLYGFAKALADVWAWVVAWLVLAIAMLILIVAGVGCAVLGLVAWAAFSTCDEAGGWIDQAAVR